MLQLKEKLVLLLDDDPVFQKVVAQECRRYNLSMTSCETLEKFRELTSTLKFDVAIVDFHLGKKHTGAEVAELTELPIVMVSSNRSKRIEHKVLKFKSVKAFIHKDEGVPTILCNALFAVEPQGEH